MAEDYMFGEKIHAFASFPVTQQAIGIFATVVGLIVTIGSVVERIFHGIEKSVLERQLKNEIAIGLQGNLEKTSSLKNRINILEGFKNKSGEPVTGRIKDDNDGIGTGILLFTLGLLTTMPVVGSVLNGFIWYKEVQTKKAALDGPIYA
jgi:hypothetical protein